MRKILILLAVTTLASCSKSFLNRGSLTQIGQDNFWKTENDALLGLNGVYDVLQDRVEYGGNLNGEMGFPMYDCIGDNCYNGYKWEGLGAFEEGTINPSSFQFNDLWSSLYRGVARANVAIQNINNMPSSAISDQDKQALVGQALFLRSLFYFNLAVYFQDVPLILKPQTLQEAYVPKNTFQEVMAQVVKDLNTAASTLPTSYPASQYGYATKGAALALLARADLYMQNWQGVLDATNQVMQLGYSLDPNYANLFTEKDENSPEIIFSVRFVQDATPNGETFSSTYPGVPKVDEQPMPNLVNSYYCTDGLPITQSPLYSSATPKANRDPRLSATVYFKGDVFLTDINKVFAGNTATGYGKRKYVVTSASSTGIAVYAPGGQDFIVLRYADVLLMRAEAMVELNQLSGVYPLIDQIRARVHMPSIENVEGTGLSQDQLRTIVRHERRVELALEGLRFFDLKRWSMVQQSFQAASGDKVKGYSPNYQGPKSEIFPIPQSDLDANNNLVQNPAWQ